MEATHLLNRPIDQLVTFETPVRYDYQPKQGMISHHVAISNSSDIVQVFAGGSTTLQKLGYSLGSLFSLGRVGYIAGLIASIKLGGTEAGFSGKKFEYMPNIINIDAGGYTPNRLLNRTLNLGRVAAFGIPSWCLICINSYRL